MHPNLKLLSASSNVLLHKCPRKFQLYRMMKLAKDPDAVEVHLDFGHWVGEGIQQYLVTGSREKAMMAMLRFNKGDLFSEDGQRDKKTFWHALVALDKFIELRHSELQHHELVRLNSGPAVELGFILNCIGDFSYRGFIDALLRNTITNELVVLECKTSKFKQVHDAQYKNSGQGLGYSLVVDAISAQLTAAGTPVGSAWKVMYPIYLAGAFEWELKMFPKGNSQRARWLSNLINDIQRVAEYAENNHFPMHGENCYDYFRPCEYFEVCEMSDSVLIGDEEKVAKLVDDESRYSFRFDMMELVAAQQAKLAEQE